MHLGVDPANQRAIAVYDRLGFARLHELPDAVIMGIGLRPAGLALSLIHI